MLPVIQHAVQELSSRGWTPGIVVLLQPTSPLRRPEHVRQAVAPAAPERRGLGGHGRRGAQAPVAGLRDADRGRRAASLPARGGAVTRRQDARAAYSRDGTVYAFRRETLDRFGSIYGADCRPLVIPGERIAVDRHAARLGRGRARCWPAICPSERPLRKLVPRPIRRGVSVQLAEMQAQRLERDLRGLVAQRETIVAGPWLGEVGFELLYWVPFLRWFAERFRLPPERLLVVSRGGTASWYRPFRRGLPRDLRPRARRTSFARCTTSAWRPTASRSRRGCWSSSTGCCGRLTEDVEHRTMLHPSSMYRLFSPFWWGHLDERWVHSVRPTRG